jgi:hypothetical protein
MPNLDPAATVIDLIGRKNYGECVVEVGWDSMSETRSSLLCVDGSWRNRPSIT